jgi:hypothetical protein
MLRYVIEKLTIEVGPVDKKLTHPAQKREFNSRSQRISINIL